VLLTPKQIEEQRRPLLPGNLSRVEPADVGHEPRGDFASRPGVYIFGPNYLSPPGQLQALPLGIADASLSPANPSGRTRLYYAETLFWLCFDNTNGFKELAKENCRHATSRPRTRARILGLLSQYRGVQLHN